MSAGRFVDVVVVGAGHNGLAMSRALSLRSLDHVVIERGEVANARRTERWDGLRLLTPNWLCRLPGQPYDGDDPDGYMAAGEFAERVSRYAAALQAPVLTRTAVLRVEPREGGYRVVTDQGSWRCRAVVLASGAFSRPALPGIAQAIPAEVRQLTQRDYRNPAQLDQGGVLVVGASASGVQIAQDIQRSGRQVTLAVGEHVRMPRVYRGRDIQWWMLECGLLDQRIEEADDPDRARRLPSPQLIGSPQRATLDINILRAQGVETVGRLAAVRDGKALFSGSLRNVCALADLKMNRLLDAIDQWIDDTAPPGPTGAAQRYAPTQIAASPRLQLALGKDIRTVVWATGMRPDHSWLHAPVFDRKGALRHDRGVVDAPGLYVLGLPFLRRRKSSFIHGAEDDVRELGSHLADYLDRTARQAPRLVTIPGSCFPHPPRPPAQGCAFDSPGRTRHGPL